MLILKISAVKALGGVLQPPNPTPEKAHLKAPFPALATVPAVGDEQVFWGVPSHNIGKAHEFLKREHTLGPLKNPGNVA